MSRVMIAYQGERGANSEDAVIRYFGEVDVLPCPTLVDAFRAVEEGKATYALVPAENSHAGTIVDTYDLLLAGSLEVFGETDLPVRHSLQALPGQRLEEIRQVYSHPQALAQCSNFLSSLGVETIAVYDTAGSAKMVAEKGMLRSAAIASRRAADLYGLEVLRENIQNSDDNVTKFYAVRPGGKSDGWLRKPDDLPQGDSMRGQPEKGEARTVLVLGTEDRPAALYWCLSVLAYWNINLIKLESRPNRRKPWEYNFYLVLAAHADDEPCRMALQELKTKTTLLRVLGSYRPDSELKVGRSR